MTRLRRHFICHYVEMAAAMSVGMMAIKHVAMLAGILAAMPARRAEYFSATHHHPVRSHDVDNTNPESTGVAV